MPIFDHLLIIIKKYIYHVTLKTGVVMMKTPSQELIMLLTSIILHYIIINLDYSIFQYCISNQSARSLNIVSASDFVKIILVNH